MFVISNIKIAIDDPLIEEMSNKYKVSKAEVCIGYALARGLAVVTKTENESRMKDNLKSLELLGRFAEEDLKLIDNLNRNQRNHVDIYNIK